MFVNGPPTKRDHFPSIGDQIKTIKAVDVVAKDMTEEVMARLQEKQLRGADQKFVVADDAAGFESDEASLAKEVQESLDGLGKDLITNKIAERDIFEQSVANGGPSDTLGAIVNMMDYAKVGIRQLSRQVNVPRSQLQAMIDGRRSMPPEVLTKVIEVFEKAKPDLFGLASTPSSKKL